MAKLVNQAAKERQRLKEQKEKRTLIAVIAALVLVLISVIIFAANSGSRTTTTSDGSFTAGDGTSGKDTMKEVNTEELSIDMSLTYYADIEIENYGNITVKLDQSAAPITVDNFVTLAQSGFYDGLTFHRIMENFMMQGGDPNGNGTGGSGKNIAGEFVANGYNNTLSHTRGAVSMARASKYDSASSQFFIVHQDCPDSLDGLYAVFGYVTEGMDVVDAVCTAAQPIDNNGTIPADEQPVIKAITIRTE